MYHINVRFYLTKQEFNLYTKFNTMKKSLLLCFMLICSLSFFTSCKDDKDDNKIPDQDYAADLAGTYAGKLDIKLITPEGEAPVPAPESSDVNVYVTGKNLIKLELKDLAILGLTLNISVPEVPVTGDGSVITLVSTDTDIDDIKDLGHLDITLSGTVNADNSIQLTIDVTATDKGQHIMVKFKGSKTGEDYAAAITGNYVGTINFKQLNDETPEIAPYKQSVSIVRTARNTVSLKVATGTMNQAFDLANLTVAKDGEAYVVSLSSKTDTVLNEAKTVLEKATINNKVLDFAIRTFVPNYSSSGKIDKSYRITSAATYTEKLKEAYLTGMTWKANELVIGDCKIENKAGEISSEDKAGSKYYGMIKNSGDLTFYVMPGTTYAQLNQLETPTFSTTDNAGYTLKSLGEDYSSFVDGLIFNNFGMAPQAFVVAEDGLSYTLYNILYEAAATLSASKSFNFDSWKDFEDYKIPGTEWAVSNEGLRVAKNMAGYKGDYPVNPGAQADAAAGKSCAKLVTLLTNEGSAGFLPKITAGSLFFGTFKTNSNDYLKSTQFGIICTGKVTAVTGKFKYTPGTEYWNSYEKDNSGKKDECAISAVLYEVDSYAESLDGNNIYTSDKIVAVAQHTAGETPGYTDFTLNLKYKKAFDPSKKYKFALIFSSSKDGDKYYGAVNSTLYVDEVNVTVE